MARLNLLILLLSLCALQSCAQTNEETKKFESRGYQISYPAGWLVSEEGKIVNIYPSSERGAVSISDYSGIDFPLEETRTFILDMHELSGDPKSVTMTENNGVFEFTHEFTKKADSVRWHTRAIRKGSDFFLITINCPEDQWQRQKAVLVRVADSFKIK